MKITAIEKRKSSGNVRMIYVNGEYSFDISEELYLKHGIYEKSDLTEAEINSLKKSQTFIDAKDEALRFIQAKLRSEKEVMSRLLRSGFEDSTAQDVVNGLKSLGYLDDAVFARKYISEKVKLNPKSTGLIKAELIAKGISEGTAQDALREYGTDDASNAKALVKKKFGKLNCNDLNIQKKIYNFLAYRGFKQEFIENLLNNLKKS